MAAVYYLQWHQKSKGSERATDLFHRFHRDPPATLTESVFDELYQEVAEVETNDFEQLFAGWNAGSGRESDQFRDMRYCERCTSYIEGSGEAEIHAVENHGYDAFHEASAPDYIHRIRSMSVGDIVRHGDTHYACAAIGWSNISI